MTIASRAVSRAATQANLDHFSITRPDYWHIGHNLSKIRMDVKTRSTLEYGIVSFKYLIPNGATLTAAQFADLICENYDATEPRTAAVVSALRTIGATS